MKRLLCYLSVTLLAFLFSTNMIDVYAVNTSFSTEELQEKDMNTFISNVNLSLLIEKPTERAIQCFDVNENGMIAIGQEGTDGKELCIYSSDGIFQYGYTFNCGQSFAVEWNGKDINIFFVRSDIIMTINREGEILDIAKVQNTIDNNTYQNYLLYSTERTSRDTRYMLRNDMGVLNLFSTSYSQLIATNSTGEEIILYNVGSIQSAKVLTMCVIVSILFLLIVVVTSRQLIILKRNL